MEATVTQLGFMSSSLNSLVSIPLDVQPETDSPAQGKANAPLEVFSLVFAIGSWLPSLFSIIKITSAPKDPAEEEQDWLIWSLFGIESILLAADGFSFVTGSERFKRLNTVTVIIASVVGAMHAVLLIINIIPDKGDAPIDIPLDIANVLMALPEPFSWVRLIKHPYASAAFGIIDVVAFMAAFTSINLYWAKISPEVSPAAA